MSSEISLINHVKELEHNAEEEIIGAWKEHWLPCHENNPLVPTERAANVTCLMEQEEYFGMSEDEVVQAFFDKEDAKTLIDTNDISQMNPESILKELKMHRNFCSQNEDTSEFEFLKSGNIMLYTVKVPQFSLYFEKEKELKDGAVTLCFVKDNSSIIMYVIGKHGFSSPYSFGSQNWIYRSGTSVVFCLVDVCVHRIRFNSVEDAMKFEFQFMFLGEFLDKNVIFRLRGDFPVQLLFLRGYECDAEYKDLQIGVLNNSVRPEQEAPQRPLKISFTNLMEKICSRIEDYLRNIYSLQVFLFQSSISFRVPVETQHILQEILQDLETILKITICCILPETTTLRTVGSQCNRSIYNLAQDIFQLRDNMHCCMMMCQNGALYQEYLQKFIDIFTTVDKYITKYESENALLREAVDLEKKSPDGRKHEMAAESNLISKVTQYLESRDPKFYKVFGKLDKTLRLGGISIFDVLCKNLKPEIVQVLFNSKTVYSVDKGFFDDRYTSFKPEAFDRSTTENHVRLSELAELPEMFSLGNANKLSMGEYVVVRKVYKSVELLQNFTKEIEAVLKFDFKEWLELVPIWRKLDADSEEYLDVVVEMGSLDVTTPGKKNLRSSDDSYEKISSSFEFDSFVFPLAWQDYNKYEKKEFQKIKNLGEGGYGCAKILKHEKWRYVVLKKYSFATEEIDRIKEINMLIRLQSNAHIVKLFGFYYSEKAKFGLIPEGILLEYIERNLHSFIHETKGHFFKHSFRFGTAIEQMQGMASAFAAMHKQGIMHRDIKPDNILLTYGDKIRVCDLGMCGSIDKTIKTKKHIGTLIYNSPEIHDELEYTEKTDVFSLGVTMWEQIHRREPYCKFGSKGEIIDFVCEGNRLEFDEACLPELKLIIQKAWAQNPAERPSMEGLEEMLGALLNSLSEENLDEDVIGPFMKTVVDGMVFYEKNMDLFSKE